MEKRWNVTEQWNQKTNERKLKLSFSSVASTISPSPNVAPANSTPSSSPTVTQSSMNWSVSIFNKISQSGKDGPSIPVPYARSVILVRNGRIIEMRRSNLRTQESCRSINLYHWFRCPGLQNPTTSEIDSSSIALCNRHWLVRLNKLEHRKQPKKPTGAEYPVKLSRGTQFYLPHYFLSPPYLCTFPLKDQLE